MAQFVAAEDREDRQAVPETMCEHGCPRNFGDVDVSKVRNERGVVQRAGERGRDDGDDEEHDVTPDAILELRARLPGPRGLNRFVDVGGRIHSMEL